MAGKKSPLDRIEEKTADELDKKRRAPTKSRSRAQSDARRSGKRKGRKPPVVPEGTAAEIKAMDPDDPLFKHPAGAKRKYPDYNDVDTTQLSWREVVRVEKQKSANNLRAKARKHEAVVEKVTEEEQPNAARNAYAEDVLIADGKLSIDDWDEEELIRGYRRGRNGRFGEPPKYIPREVQQEAFRRLVRLGERRMRQEYLSIVDELINLATDRTVSDKVRLEAIKEVQNRVVGKTPDVTVSVEAPWQDMLVDSLIPMTETDALLVEGHVLSLPPGGGEDPPSSAAATYPAKGEPSSPPDDRGQDSVGIEADWEGEE